MYGTSFINFDGITLHSGRFDLLNTNNTTFENCRFLYSTHNGHMLKSDLQMTHWNNKATTKKPGDNNLVWRNCEFAYSYGIALQTGANQGTLLENNVFHNSNIFIKGGNGGPLTSGNTDLTARRNTVYSMGFGGLGRPGKNNTLELNQNDKERIFNLGYYTWVEQQGISTNDFEKRRNQHFWNEHYRYMLSLDDRISDFNSI